MSNAASAKPSGFRGVLPRLRGTIENPSDRAVLSVFFAGLFCLHYGAGLLVPTQGELFVSTFRAAEFMGFAAVVVILNGLSGARLLRWFDLAFIVLAAIVLIHPWRRFGALALTGVGFLFLTRTDRRLSSLGQVCLGFAWIDIWGKMLLGFISTWLLPIETAIGYFVVKLFGSFALVGNAIIGENGYRILIFPGCSAFSNTITASFIWLCLIKIQEDEFRRWHFIALAAILAGVVVINSVRIALMAYSFDQGLYWHGGPGAAIIAVTMLLLVFAIFFYGQFRDRRMA